MECIVRQDYIHYVKVGVSQLTSKVHMSFNHMAETTREASSLITYCLDVAMTYKQPHSEPSPNMLRTSCTGLFLLAIIFQSTLARDLWSYVTYDNLQFE